MVESMRILDTDSGSGALDHGGHDEKELNKENHDDDGGGPVSDEDDEVHVRQKVAEVDPVKAASLSRS